MIGSVQIEAFVWQPVAVPYAKFPDLLHAFLKQSPETPGLEAQGYALRTSNPMAWDDIEAFIKAVCKWAGPTGNRVRGQVLKPGKTATEDAMRVATIETRCGTRFHNSGPVGPIQ
jgi:hypothetical protein